MQTASPGTPAALQQTLWGNISQLTRRDDVRTDTTHYVRQWLLARGTKFHRHVGNEVNWNSTSRNSSVIRRSPAFTSFRRQTQHQSHFSSHPGQYRCHSTCAVNRWRMDRKQDLWHRESSTEKGDSNNGETDELLCGRLRPGCIVACLRHSPVSPSAFQLERSISSTSPASTPSV